MKNETKFWIVTSLFIVILMMLLFYGCYPDEPPVAIRHCDSGMQIGSVNTQSVYDGVNSRPDGDLCLKHWARLMLQGEPLKIGNSRVEMDTLFIWPTGATAPGPRRTLRANNKGYFRWSIPFCPPDGSFQVGYTCRVSSPRSGSSIGGTFGRVASASYCPGYNDPADYCFRPWVYDYEGTYWASGSQVGHAHLTDAQLVPLPRPPQRLVQLSATDSEFLSREPNEFSDFVCVAGAQWNWLTVTEENEYYAKPTNQFVMLDDFRNDPNYATLIAENSTPYFCKWQFWTAEPLQLQDRIYTGQMSIGDANEPNFVEPVQITIIADSADLKSHIAVSEYIVIAEPNDYSPFHVEDIFVVPLDEGQTIGIDFDDLSQIIGDIARFWLTACKGLDRNKDNIVNLKDLP